MMSIVKKQDNGVLTIALEGRMDIVTAQDLEKEINSSLDGVTELIFDLEKLTYISSAGLRVLLLAQKKMNKQGSMKVIRVNEMVLDVFVAMGFADIVTERTCHIWIYKRASSNYYGNAGGRSTACQRNAA